MVNRWAAAWLVLWLPSVANAQRPPSSGEAGDGDAARADAPLGEPALLDGAVDPDRYVVGPGDRLLVELWGLHDFNTVVEVNAEGRLLVPKVGVFAARGETLATLRGAVEQQMKRIYPSLRGGVTLARPRTFLVAVTGAVARPGSYPATPVTRVSALLQRAGGTLPRGSLRAIEVRRGADRVIADLLRWTLLGERGGDPTVLDGDTLYVPLRQTDVEVTGAVRRPGRYELTGRHDVAELLELAGGLDGGFARAQPLRLSERRDGSARVRSVKLDDARAIVLDDGAAVHVPAIAELRQLVIVSGAIVGPPDLPLNPGVAPATNTATSIELQRSPYLVDRRADAAVGLFREVSVPVAFVDGDTIRDLLNKVGGLQPWADGAHAFVLRPVASGERKRIDVDVPAISSGAAPDVEARPGDTLVVPSRREEVLVGGAVQRPGLYQYNPALHPQDYITLAGGVLRTGRADAARVVTRSGDSRLLSKAGAIEPGDAISVPERKVTVGEWIEIALIVGNLAATTAAIILTQVH